MVSIIKPNRPAPPNAEPAWDIARLFPLQGCWDEDDYLALDTNHLVEFTDGSIEVLPMPKMSHQLIVKYLAGRLDEFVRTGKLGTVLFAPFRIRIRGGKYREPDVCFMSAANAPRMNDEFWEGADLVIEVVSDDAESRQRDLEKKRADYAEAQIPEYWIVDPVGASITVHILHDGKHRPVAQYKAGDVAPSSILEGFSVEVEAVMTAANSS